MQTNKKQRTEHQPPTEEQITSLYTLTADYDTRRNICNACYRYAVPLSGIDCTSDGDFDITKAIKAGDVTYVFHLVPKLVQIIEFLLVSPDVPDHIARITIGLIAGIIADGCFYFANDHVTTSKWYTIALSLCPCFAIQFYACAAVSFARITDASAFYYIHRAIDITNEFILKSKDGAELAKRQALLPRLFRTLCDFASWYFNCDFIKTQLIGQIKSPDPDASPFDAFSVFTRDPAKDVERFHEYMMIDELTTKPCRPWHPKTPQLSIVFTGNCTGSSTINRVVGYPILPSNPWFPTIVTLRNDQHATKYTISVQYGVEQFNDAMAWGQPEFHERRKTILESMGIHASSFPENATQQDIFPDDPDYAKLVVSYGFNTATRKYDNPSTINKYIGVLNSSPISLFIKQIDVVAPINSISPHLTLVQIPSGLSSKRWAIDHLALADKLVYINSMRGTIRFDETIKPSNLAQVRGHLKSPQVPVVCCFTNVTSARLHASTQLGSDHEIAGSFLDTIKRWADTENAFILDNGADAGRPFLNHQFFAMHAFIHKP